MIYNASDIAKVILKLSNPEYGDTISNLKLQKLLYYQQGFHLATFDTPLFEEDIEAWMYGPVIPCIYNEYKHFGQGAIEIDERFDVPDTLTDAQKDLIIEVYEVYGQYAAFRLMEFTHQEEPWKHVPHGPGNIISKESMRRFFKSRI
jgi:uncharacterized phage-associated protein